MTSRIRREIHELRTAEPGTRFEAGFERTHVRNRPLRLALVVLGLGLVLAAAVTFFLPGPNFVLVLAGLALVGGQSRTVARLMDRGEVAARRWHREHWEPYPHKAAAKAVAVAVALAAVAVAVALAAVALAAWVAHERGWVPGWVPVLGS